MKIDQYPTLSGYIVLLELFSAKYEYLVLKSNPIKIKLNYNLPALAGLQYK